MSLYPKQFLHVYKRLPSKTIGGFSRGRHKPLTLKVVETRFYDTYNKNSRMADSQVEPGTFKTTNQATVMEDSLYPAAASVSRKGQSRKMIKETKRPDPRTARASSHQSQKKKTGVGHERGGSIKRRKLDEGKETEEVEEQEEEDTDSEEEDDTEEEWTEEEMSSTEENEESESETSNQEEEDGDEDDDDDEGYLMMDKPLVGRGKPGRPKKSGRPRGKKGEKGKPKKKSKKKGHSSKRGRGRSGGATRRGFAKKYRDRYASDLFTNF